MSKKDYIALARMFRTQRQRIIHTNNTIVNGNADEMLHSQLDSILESLSNILADDNPRFDRVRFLQACGIETS